MPINLLGVAKHINHHKQHLNNCLRTFALLTRNLSVNKAGMRKQTANLTLDSKVGSSSMETDLVQFVCVVFSSRTH